MMRSYHALHGGLNRKHAGILVLIHKTFIASQGIRSASIVPGRLLQIRLDTEPAITIFAVYQTVWADGSKQETSLTHRELLWSKLDSAIKGVSKRSQLLIAGDLNTPCLSHPPNVGPSVLATLANVKQKDQQRLQQLLLQHNLLNTPCLSHPPNVGPSVLATLANVKQKDQQRLQQLLLQHNLIALNTWGRRKYCHTYQFETAGSVHRTQIDFLLFRAQHSDALAKSARTIQAPFVPPTGMRHLPLLVSLPKPVAPRTGPSGGTRVTAREVASSLRQDPALSTRFQQEVQRLFSGNTAGDPAHALNQVILQAWKIVKPSPVPTRALPNPTAGLVLQLWTLRKQRNHAEFVARASFMRKWLLATRISRTQRLLKQACRAKKRARVEVLLEEAENSPRPSTVFSVIRRLAPKSKVMRVQLRDALGRLLIGEEEAAFIAKYLRKIFSSEAKSGPPDSAPITGPEFTYDELKGALECLAGNKALPSAFAPAQLWKLVPDVVVPSLLPVMNLQSDHLQSEWHKVQLCLIPKLPVVREPKSLRPISLLHPANKLLATMLADRVRPKVCQYLATVPQWAYLPGRSAADALESVCSHLFQVSAATPARREIHQEPEPSPQKFTRFNDKGQGGKGPKKASSQTQEQQGRGRRRQYPADQLTANAEHQQPGSAPSRALVSATLVAKMAQLLLRHADALNGLEQSTSWVMFQGTAPPLTVVDLQARVGAEWHQLKATNPSAVTQPLRVILWQTWASELVKRIQALDTDQGQRQEAIRLNILTEPNCFKYVQWNPAQRTLVNRDDQAPLTAKEIIDMLKETIVLCREEGVMPNFHPMRKLTPNMSGAVVTFALILGLREARAYRMWTIMEALAGNSVLQLAATTLRRERRGRSPLARAIEQELRQLRPRLGLGP
eukprot:s9624_g1.t1